MSSPYDRLLSEQRLIEIRTLAGKIMDNLENTGLNEGQVLARSVLSLLRHIEACVEIQVLAASTARTGHKQKRPFTTGVLSFSAHVTNT